MSSLQRDEYLCDIADATDLEEIARIVDVLDTDGRVTNEEAEELGLVLAERVVEILNDAHYAAEASMTEQSYREG